ncbi:MAG: rhomboid family intramembrane serine protease [Bacteroidetes bacterium]|nr:rhomboid family intramembrane serine protease [Bacteroidota bacterium]MDA1268343.1 rhomboid family intramembrane serine protease [Bacteroidota bacterium]
MDFSLTTLLIGITALSSIIAFGKPVLLDRWMFIPYRIKQRNQWDRFVLSGFIHKDYMHLLFNMFTFYFFGGVVERFFKFQFGLELGGLIFLGFYLTALVIADIPTYLKQQGNSYYKALGASGGTSATVFASIILMPLSDICLFGLLCLPGFLLGGFFLIYSFIKGQQGQDNINHDAHLYGAIFGILCILLLSPGSAAMFFEQLKSYRPF